MAAAGANAGKTGLVALFKRGWHEIPEVIGSSVIAVIGFGMGLYGVKKYYDNDGDNRRFKTNYTVYRPDDPRVATIKKD